MRTLFFIFSLVLLATGNPTRARAANNVEQGIKAYEQKNYVRAFRHWALLARRGNTRAQHNIAVLYFYGLGVRQSKKNAKAWLGRAAKAGYARAQHNLGWMSERGDGAPKDLKQARFWYGKAAAQSFAPSENRLGALLFAQGNFAQARGFLERAAARGIGNAQFLLGETYARGLAVPQDDRRALRWYRAAANKGNQDGTYALALIYLRTGAGTEKQVADLFRRTATRVDAKSMNGLGFIFARGIGVSQDEEKAMGFFMNAAELGYGAAAYNLAALYADDGNEEQTYFWLLIAEQLGVDVKKEKNISRDNLSEGEQAQKEGEARQWNTTRGEK